MADVVWSPITVGDDKGKVTVFAIGDSVTREKLGIDKDEYQLLKEAGTLRDTKYPKDIGTDESPREFNLRKLNEAIEVAAGEAYANIDFGLAEAEPANVTL